MKNFSLNRKRKLTYFENVIVILFTILLLLLGSCVGFYLIIRQSTLHHLIKDILSFLLFVLSVFLICLIIYKVMIPLRQYKRLSKKLINGHIYLDYIEQASYFFPEFSSVLTQFNKILNEQRLNYETKRNSEFLALQNQINPHFLYNTLEAIRGDALSEGIDYIADITEALSTFFRYSVTDTGSLVTLADEFENVNNYFKIQQYRFGEKLELLYELPDDENVLELMCPKLTLQPIIENAIFHGLEKRIDKGKIVIRVSTTDNRVIITIIDNGVGMDDTRLDALNQRLKNISLTHTKQEENNKNGGIAMINVCKRIKLLFGENYGIHVFSIPDFGTDVRITLPIVKKNLEYGYERRVNNN